LTLDFLGDWKRTHKCGELRAAHDGASVILMGWVHRRRDLGNIIFIDLRDRTGLTQVVFDFAHSAPIHERASTLRSEYVIAVAGKVKKRSVDTVNPNLPTGAIEIEVDELRLLNDAKTPPFSISDDSEVSNEETRLTYRYLDLRRAPMQHNIELRHKVALAIRNDLSAHGFLEIETPFLTRSTPEGARDFLVPSRVHHGSFYALPQSPQIFKQILMISGFDKYFQIVRCFRDEALRADRQLEFTQIDLEMTFPQQDRIFKVVENFLLAAFHAAGLKLPTPFPRMTYDDAMRQYGSDKPDLRLPAMHDVRKAFMSLSQDQLAQLGINSSLPILGMRIPNVGKMTEGARKDIREFMDLRTKDDAAYTGAFYDFKRFEKGFPEVAAEVRKRCEAAEDDLVVLMTANTKHFDPAIENGTVAHRKQELRVYTLAGALRMALAEKYADRHKAFERTGDVAHDYRFTWVTDFPMFEYDEEEKHWNPAHHPFTSPHEHDMDKLESDPAAVRALAYDIVLNGMELGSGSIRIHRKDVQARIFRALGMSDEEAKQRFGFFLDALEYGTPPHGGIALGLDRIVMLLAHADSLREVIPFPKTAKAVDLMMYAPTPVDEKQMKELGIKIRE